MRLQIEVNGRLRQVDVQRKDGLFRVVVDGVERIVDVMPEVAVIETLNADGKLQTLRVPYGKIESCTEI